MAAVVIPVRSDLDDYSIVVELDGTSYQLRFRWNVRDGRWYMTIRTAAGVVLRAGLAVVVDAPINQRAVGDGLPRGYLIAQDTSGQGVEIEDQDDFGGRVKLLYVPEDDL